MKNCKKAILVHRHTDDPHRSAYHHLALTETVLRVLRSKFQVDWLSIR